MSAASAGRSWPRGATIPCAPCGARATRWARASSGEDPGRAERAALEDAHGDGPAAPARPGLLAPLQAVGRDDRRRLAVPQEADARLRAAAFGQRHQRRLERE